MYIDIVIFSHMCIYITLQEPSQPHYIGDFKVAGVLKKVSYCPYGVSVIREFP